MLPRSVLLLMALFVAPLPLRSAVAAQEPAPGQAPIVQEIRIIGAGAREAAVRAALRTKVGEALNPRTLHRDEEFLWNPMRIRVERVTTTDLEPGKVRLNMYVVPVEALSRVIFVGNEEFKRDELLTAAGLDGVQSIAVDRIPRLIGDLEAFYRSKGYRFAKIETESDPQKDELRVRIEEGPLVRVGDIQYTGNEAFPASSFFGVGTSLNSTIESGDGWFIFPGTPYVDETVRRDLHAIQDLYHEFGYLDARVSLAQEEFYRSDRSRVRLVFAIEEGPLYHVRSVRVEGYQGAQLAYPAERLEKELKLQPGQPFERARIAVDEAALRKFYGERGHPAYVAGRPDSKGFFRFNPPNGDPKLVVDPDHALVDVIYEVREGHRMRIRDVLVTGNSQTQDRVVRREISLEPGDLADADQAMRSWRRLIGLNYFQDPETRQPFVDWRFLETDRPDWVDLQFEVAEGQTGRMLFGGGLNTNTGPFLSISLQKDNFDLSDTPSSLGKAWSEILDGQAFTGGGQKLRLFLAPGTSFSTYSLDFLEPDLFQDHIDRISFDLRLFKTFFFLSTHEERRSGASVTLGRNFGRFFSLWARPETQRVTLANPVAGAPLLVTEIAGSNTETGVTLGATYNTVEDPFSPVDGGSVRLSYRTVGGLLGGDWNFHQTDLSFSKYYPVWEDSLDRPWVLALQGRVRHSRETGSLSGVPYTERFFLGGFGSLRGFDFRGVGPRTGLYPLGGEASWNSTMEIRFPLFSSKVRGSVAEAEYVRGAFWLDAGGLGDQFSALGATRVAAGFGIRVRIPFLPQMPLALDFGWPVSSQPFDDEKVFSFNFGTF